MASAARLCHAQDAQLRDDGVQILLGDVNADRATRGAPPLRIDPALQVAAQQHADLMARERTMEHQLAGEPPLLSRAHTAGVKFSALAENIAESDSLRRIHEAWRKSEQHNANMMNPAYDIIGIGIARSGHDIYAVEDFAKYVAVKSSVEVEQRVRDMLAIRGMVPSLDTNAARTACATEGKYDESGPLPAMVLRFASSDLEKLGPVLDEKLSGQQGRTVAVGSCQDHDSFTRYKVVVLVY